MTQVLLGIGARGLSVFGWSQLLHCRDDGGLYFARKQHGGARIGDLDPKLPESLKDPAVELTLHAPATFVGTSHLARQRHRRSVHCIDAPDLEVA